MSVGRPDPACHKLRLAVLQLEDELAVDVDIVLTVESGADDVHGVGVDRPAESTLDRRGPHENPAAAVSVCEDRGYDTSRIRIELGYSESVSYEEGISRTLERRHR